MPLATIWLGTLGLFGGAGALLDIFTRRLPNVLCGLMLLAGLVLAFMQGGLAELGLHFAHAALALVVGYLLFLAGIFGGGDGKFYAAAAAFFPLWEMLDLFIAMTAAGFVLAVIWFTLKRTMRSMKDRKDDFAKLPYGVAIAIGALTLAWMTQ